jgi:putative ABC transport system permease protein
MLLADYFKQTYVSIKTHKIRTVLAMFGIIWGTIAIILLLAITNGFYAKSMEDLAFLTNGIIFGWPAHTSKSYHGLPEGTKVHLEQNSYAKIIHAIPHLQSSSPLYTKEVLISYQNKSVSCTLNGVGTSHVNILQMKLSNESRFLNALDLDKNQKIVVLDFKLKGILFPNASPLKKTIFINSIPFKIVGFQTEEGQINLGGWNNNIYIPYTTFLALYGALDVEAIFLVPNVVQDTGLIKKHLQNLLASVNHYDPTDDEAFRIPDLETQQVFIVWFFRIIKLFLGFCGLLTLSVGGVSVANMMFLIVKERTAEIGLRKALGAKESQILLQFMIETFFIVAGGGFFGGSIAVMLITFMQHLHLPAWLGTPYISWSSFSFALLILLLLGFIAGFFPARQAARLDPIKALTSIC